ncbi:MULTISPECIES: methyltransferase regulatory domain-containing protein [unclassified Variovorax]|uniref:methyltransferase regulatory domain-containing protein n=1 Tax=unclassified Variovorax TaxID=663243 RepID=UPI001BD478C9|nr:MULTISPECIES: methyltransferase regulatory domain-containing protein [unclassified Variovorax]
MPDKLTSAITSYYDAVPYDSHPFPQSAPEHLEALAYLFGLEAEPPAVARVLELGCAAGGNLIPFAARHPAGRAIGVDVSPVQVGQGAAAIEQAGLGNVGLRAFDIHDIDASFGKFDYIVCHGVYSWVPPTVQSAILRVCSENLAPNGVAYVSYNVYPGWKSREIVRDAMILRGGPRDAPEEKLSFARGMLEFLEQSARKDSVLEKTLEEAMPIVRNASSAYLLHEFLEPCNAPCYFKEFVERADAYGLAYLADAEPSTMFVQNYGEKVREPLLRECGGSQVMMEQYLDFLVNRTFRQTLLVRKERAGQIRYRLDPARLRSLAYAGVFLPDDGGAIKLDGPEQPCTALRNQKLTLRLPVHKAVAQVLDQHYPAAVLPDVLLDEVAARTGEPRDAVEPFVMAMLEELLILGAVRLRRSPFGAAVTVTERPRALAAVRSLPGLALHTGPSAQACNLWHESVALSPLERCLLPLLDGSHGHDALADHLVAEARAGRIRFIKNEQPLKDESVLREFAAQQVALALQDLRRKGLLAA